MNCEPGANMYTVNHASIGSADYLKRFVSLVRHNAGAMELIEASIHLCTDTSTTIVIRNHGNAARDVTANILIIR